MVRTSRSRRTPVRLIVALAVAAAMIVVGCGSSPSPSTPAPSEARPTTLPAEVSTATWIERDRARDIWVAYTLGGGRLELPSGERVIEVADGIVVSGDGSAMRPGGHVTVRRFDTGEVLADADLGSAITSAAIGLDAVFVSSVEIDGVVPGLWRVAFDGTVTTVEEPRPPPPDLAGLSFRRSLLLSPSEGGIVSAICWFDGFAISPVPCDLDLIDARTFVVAEIARGLVAEPILTAHDVLIVWRTLGDRYVIAAIDLAGRERWQVVVPSLPSAFIDAERGRLIVGYRPDPADDDTAIAAIALDTGERTALLQVPPDLGYFYPDLSSGRFVVLSSASPEAGDSISGSLVSVFDTSSGLFVVRDVPVR